MNQLTALERDKIWDNFLAAWPVSRVRTMSLEEYSQAGGRDTFTYWIEGGTQDLGSIWGGSAFKFGIYHMNPSREDKGYEAETMYKSDAEYAWYSKIGNTRDEAFQITKQRILDVIEAVQSDQLEDIGPIGLGRAIKWKVAALYQNRRQLPVIPLFNKPALKLIMGVSDGRISTAELQRLARKKRGDKPFWDFYDECLRKWFEQKKSDLEGDDSIDAEDAEIGDKDLEPTTDLGVTRYWVYSAGKGGEFWNKFHAEGIMAIGWDYLGDLKQYTTKEMVAQAMRDHDKDQDASKKNNSNSCFAFGHQMKPGDVVFAKIGMNKIVGKGVITSDYEFIPTRDSFKHVRKVDWQAKGNWPLSNDNRIPLKTITEMTRYPDVIQHLLELVSGEKPVGEVKVEYDAKGEGVQFWWLNANPKIWDFSSTPIGSRQTYTSHNAAGNKRRVYQYFTQIKPGDIVLGYVSTPLKQITAMCRVTKALHDSTEGEVIEFEKIEQFPEPIPLKRLQSIKQLEQCEPLINNQGSLFKIKTDEFELIRSIIDEENSESISAPTVLPKYSKKELLLETGYDSEKIEGWLKTIERKKQVVFFGPPGTGKTFIAERLARNIVSETDGFYDSIQFHPSYSYEEFMQGIRPDSDEKGNLQFEMKSGRFMEFCSKARARKGPCVLIIDELNRANLSRVFGELMYLLEYRNKEMFLAGGMKFSIPDNVRIIATMNTADRSIALVDFALRRRFAFLELAPEYEILRNYHKGFDFDAGPLIYLLHAVNQKIDDKNFHLGISFFMSKTLKQDLEEIWRLEIETYLEEYFFGQPNSVSDFTWEKVKDKILV
jgi:MoxR-like ATPase